MRIRIIFSLILFVVFLNACAGPIPKNMRDEVSPNTGFERVIRDPAEFVGKTVLWGGEIIETKNHEDYSLIEMIQKPLGFKERPLAGDESEGRFLVEYRGQFLDPAIYKIGREVTIVGEIIRAEKKKLDEMHYRYPYVLASYVYLWPKRVQQMRIPYRSPYYCDPFWRGCRYAFDPYYPDPSYDLYPDPFLRRPFGLFPNRSPFFFQNNPHQSPTKKAK
ncbi:hypothetical protein MNBD_NITROSPIRAE01-2071 [hydrothermal vent metagenome]|uniref:Starvation lipoprotein Slp paralog n=1 Tax=hydrothermal vent metagenome TaxID=652676 RepID=A0A3B1D4X2_9ZZZZ